MDLISRAVRNSRRSVRGASGEWGDSSIPPNSATNYGGGGYLNEQGALAISTVYMCAKVLYEDQGILPFRAYQGEREGYRKAIAKQPLIVSQPFGPDLPRSVGFGQMRLSYAMRGNVYVQRVASDRMGYWTQVKVAHPDRVRVKRDENGVKKFSIANGPWLGGEDVKHIMGPSLPGSDIGMDPITCMRVAMDLARDAAQFGANFFQNGASPSGVISVKGPGDKTKARALKDTWEAGHAGVVNAHRPAVLFGGATWAPMSVSPENAQFLQTRASSREEICGWMGVPLQRIQAIVDNASQGGAGGLESIEQGYLTHTWLPWTTTVEEMWDGFLPGDQSTWTLFDFSALLRVSAFQRAQIAQIHRLTGVRNRNEIRADEGWAPIEGLDGEDYNIPFNTNSAVPPLPEPGQELVDGKVTDDNATASDGGQQ